MTYRGAGRGRTNKPAPGAACAASRRARRAAAGAGSLHPHPPTPPAANPAAAAAGPRGRPWNSGAGAAPRLRAPAVSGCAGGGGGVCVWGGCPRRTAGEPAGAREVWGGRGAGAAATVEWWVGVCRPPARPVGCTGAGTPRCRPPLRPAPAPGRWELRARGRRAPRRCGAEERVRPTDRPGETSRPRPRPRGGGTGGRQLPPALLIHRVRLREASPSGRGAACPDFFPEHFISFPPCFPWG